MRGQVFHSTCPADWRDGGLMPWSTRWASSSNSSYRGMARRLAHNLVRNGDGRFCRRQSTGKARLRWPAIIPCMFALTLVTSWDEQ
ncbi:hypothetical protein BJY00DRAFT_292316 [Aspergillus carlsbadensis]|nr:hypothetical protein BJY00DRAFT_292316 [Aspergillus carlsbadensis]